MQFSKGGSKSPSVVHTDVLFVDPSDISYPDRHTKFTRLPTVSCDDATVELLVVELVLIVLTNVLFDWSSHS